MRNTIRDLKNYAAEKLKRFCAIEFELHLKKSKLQRDVNFFWHRKEYGTIPSRLD